MMQSKLITTEAATLTSQSLSSQGIATKGKKGKQSLFSKLLATLGQGKQKQNKTSEESNKQSVKVISNPKTQQNIKTLTLTTATPHNADNNNPLATVKESKHDKNNNAENISSQNIAVATLVQAPSVMQNLPKTKSGQPMLPSKAQGAQKTNAATLGVFSEQKIAANPNINPEKHTVEKQNVPIVSQATVQKASPSTPDVFLEQKTTPVSISSTKKQTKPAIQTVSQETSALLPNKTIISTNSNELVSQNNKDIDHLIPSKAMAHLSTAQTSEVNPLGSKGNEKHVAKINKVEAKVETSQEQSASEPRLATLTKASMPKAHVSQGIDQAGAANVSATSLSKATEVGSNTSQQNFTSDQQDMNGLYIDSNKHETKLKGADFQAQLAYKSQRTFAPADAMMEIVKSAKDGSTSLELQLEPAHLGKVQVQIHMDASKHIQVAFTVDQQTSKQALEQHMPQLRLALSQQGLDLGSFSMQMNQQQHQGHQSSHSTTTSSTWGNQNIEEQIQNNPIGINIATDGRLSILA